MPYIICPYCNKRSYSAANLDVWTCPYCNRDIKKEEEKGNTKKEQEK